MGIAGVGWCIEQPGWLGWALLVAGVLIGMTKGHWILAKTAKKASHRIRERGDDRCIGSFFSWQSWLLALVMSTGGYLLRHSHASHALLGVLYLTIGIALLWGARVFWMDYLKQRPQPTLHT